MKLVNVRNKLWWVPATNRVMLAVQVDDPAQYYRAIRAKIRALILAEGTMEKAVRMATWAMEPQGLKVQPTEDPDNLVDQLLATASVGETVRSGDPELAEPAPEDEAVSAVEVQDELDLVNFLT